MYILRAISSKANWCWSVPEVIKEEAIEAAGLLRRRRRLPLATTQALVKTGHQREFRRRLCKLRRVVDGGAERAEEPKRLPPIQSCQREATHFDQTMQHLDEKSKGQHH